MRWELRNRERHYQAEVANDIRIQPPHSGHRFKMFRTGEDICGVRGCGKTRAEHEETKS